jgi:hypothetical protein
MSPEAVAEEGEYRGPVQAFFHFRTVSGKLFGRGSVYLLEHSELALVCRHFPPIPEAVKVPGTGTCPTGTVAI